jgi:serine/threonine protein kinase
MMAGRPVPSERWQQIEQLYHAARERAPAEREAFLDEACRGDAALRREVQSLLGPERGDFLETPALEAAAQLMSTSGASAFTGRTIGVYQVQALLGAGGMGEVYRARDMKLGRDVAIKILPESFSHDPERIARFRREAQVLASLNHPHIGAIYGLDEANGQQFLVLELIDGETLADRLKRGALPLDEALAIAKQIAEALEAAHGKGIIHRDLKPANIALTQDGHVKVLDFGLAKATEAASSAAVDLANSPTITSPAMMTGFGVILGTAAYMSPEQAKGRTADKRSDIWAFGCVLYEMLTGTRAFAGEDVSDTLAAILRGEPNWDRIPADVPPSIHALVRGCLKKDRNQRISDVSTALFLLDEPLALPAIASARAPTPRPLWKRALPVLAGIVLAVAITSVGWWTVRPSGPPPTVTRFTFTLPEGQQFSNTNRQIISISPDGQQIAYVANGRLYLRSMSDLEARLIAGEVGVGNPAFSPDGQSLAFYTAGDLGLRRIAVGGGAAVTIGHPDLYPDGVSWSQDGILFGQGRQGILRISPNGGKPEQIVKVSEGEVAYGPQMLPGGRTVLFTLAAGVGADRWDKARVVAQSLTSGERKTLIEGGSDGRYLPTGHIVYALGGTLFAMRFDSGRLQVMGGPVPILEGVRRAAGGATGSPAAFFGFSDTGSLVYIPGPGSLRQLNLALVGRTGGIDTLKLPQAPYESPRISPDGKRITVDTDDGKEAIVWIFELSGASAMRRLTFEGRNRFPIWSADGERVAFQSDRGGDRGIFWQRADGSGTAERLTKPEQGESHIPESWSPKGDRFSFSVTKGSAASLWIFSLQDKKAVPFGNVRSSYPLNSVFSPVYVQPFPVTGALYQVSKDYTGHHPLWSPDGKQLFYFPGGDQLVSVSVATQPSFTIGNPTPVPGGISVNTTPTGPRNHDITVDGQRFIAVVDPAQIQSGAPAASQIQVVLNWNEELKARVPMK